MLKKEKDLTHIYSPPLWNARFASVKWLVNTLKETTKTANYKLTGTSYVATASITGKEIQDTDVTLDDLEKEFGHTVRTLVDGVTKINKQKNNKVYFRRDLGDEKRCNKRSIIPSRRWGYYYWSCKNSIV